MGTSKRLLFYQYDPLQLSWHLMNFPGLPTSPSSPFCETSPSDDVPILLAMVLTTDLSKPGLTEYVFVSCYSPEANAYVVLVERADPVSSSPPAVTAYRDYNEIGQVGDITAQGIENTGAPGSSYATYNTVGDGNVSEYSNVKTNPDDTVGHEDGGKCEPC
ncbi:hypothetical protein N7456_010474 [Penicillium angulare]|uniref:Uncharacterized protein n=1 Tax=Penicillium angulare TaxID=116970 RepID=A0A9W9F6P3_9EURO|nr:hypothetical protein N7456_010474 [Penicillium angulare]